MQKRRFKPIQRTWWQFLQHIFPCILCQSGYSTHAGVCETCWQHLPWALTTVQREGLSIHIAYHYQYPINSLILHYKYHHQLIYKHLFVQALLQLKLPRAQAIVAMPISEERLAERGFNQTLILAQALSRYLNLPVWQPVLRLNAQHQKGLSRTERLEHIDEQFQIIQTEKHHYRQVLVIDDVVTTGASLSALTKALQQLGCEKISYICVAAA